MKNVPGRMGEKLDLTIGFGRQGKDVIPNLKTKPSSKKEYGFLADSIEIVSRLEGIP